MDWGEEWPDFGGGMNLSVAGGHPCRGAGGMESEPTHGEQGGVAELEWGKGLLMKGRLKKRY